MHQSIARRVIVFVEFHLDESRRDAAVGLFNRVLAASRDVAPIDRQESRFLVVGEDETDAMNLLNGDPYMQSGLYAEVRVLSATPAAGRWMGGVIWGSADDLRGKSS